MWITSRETLWLWVNFFWLHKEEIDWLIIIIAREHRSHWFPDPSCVVMYSSNFVILVIFVIFILFFTDAIDNILLVQAMLVKLLNQGKLLSILYPLRLTALVSPYNITLESLTKVTKIREMITNPGSSLPSNKFSQTIS